MLFFKIKNVANRYTKMNKIFGFEIDRITRIESLLDLRMYATCHRILQKDVVSNLLVQSFLYSIDPKLLDLYYRLIVMKY